MNKNILGLLVSGMAFVPMAGWASDWHVTQVTGPTWTIAAPGAQPQRVTKGAVVKTGVTFATQRGGRAILTDGSTVLAVGPGTTITITDRGPKTIVAQKQGVIGLEVEKRDRPHFSVQTPYLAAVVKGTNFSVEVTDQGADVDVIDGVVGVTDKKGRKTADVTAGERASVSKIGGLSVGRAAKSNKAAAAAENAARNETKNKNKNAAAKSANAGKADKGAAGTKGAGGKGKSASAGNGAGGKGAGAGGGGKGAGGKGAGSSAGSKGKGGKGGKGRGGGRK